MLFVLTGDIQTGKTRWLESLVHDLESAGITPYGVIAPGVWADRRDDPSPSEHVDANGFEKLGIDNLLLPSHERITFARRADLAERENSFDPNSQSAQAQLRWHISDAAITHVNEHFASIASELAAKERPGALIVDELGQLELKRNKGLTEAVALLDAGPFPAASHALIVVRESLLPFIENRFDSWGEHILLAPDEASRESAVEAISVQTSPF